MTRTQVGIRISDEAMKIVDAWSVEYRLNRADVVRSLLTEAMKSDTTVKAARKRMAGLSEYLDKM